MQFEYAGHTINSESLPALSNDAMWRRGIVHYLGNECAAKVSGWAKREVESAVKAFKEANGRDATAAESAAFEPTDEAKTAKKLEFIEAAVNALNEGTVGVIVRGPAIDPVEVEMERIAKTEIADILRANGIKVPKKDEAVTFADGTSKSMADMIAKRLADETSVAPGERDPHSIRIRKAAEKRVAARKKEVEKAKAVAANAETKTATDLGL